MYSSDSSEYQRYVQEHLACLLPSLKHGSGVSNLAGDVSSDDILHDCSVAGVIRLLRYNQFLPGLYNQGCYLSLKLVEGLNGNGRLDYSPIQSPVVTSQVASGGQIQNVLDAHLNSLLKSRVADEDESANTEPESACAVESPEHDGEDNSPVCDTALLAELVSEARKSIDEDFERLVSASDEVDSTTDQQENGAAPTPSDEAQLTETDLSPYRKLAGQGSWNELMLLCEDRLNTIEGEDSEARLWWIKSQIELDAVPMSILSAPMDTATRNVSEDEISICGEEIDESRLAEVRRLALEVLQQGADKLAAIGDHATAVTFLHRSFKAGAPVSDKLLSCVESYQQELDDIPDYQRSAEQSESIEFLRELKDDLAAHNEHLQKEAKRAALLNMKTTAEEKQVDASTEQPDDIKHTSGLKSVSLESDHTDLSSFGAVPERSKLWQRAIAAIGVVSVVVLFFAAWKFGGLNWIGWVSASSERFAFEETSLVGIDVKPRLKFASLRRVGTLGHLDALYYDIGLQKNTAATDALSDILKQAAAAERAAAPVRTAAPVTQVAVSAPPAATRVVRHKKPAPSQPLVNTDEPAEPLEIRNILLSGGYRPEEASRPVIDENYVKSFPGGGQASKAGYPVYRFSPPKVYRVVATTRVLMRPSFRSGAKSELKAGSYIEVVEDLSIWLKLKSRKGQYGYILAQDAVPQ